MNEVRVGDGVSMTLVYDGHERQGWPNRGNFLGLHFVPPRGGHEWIAVNGDCGNCDTAEEARREILLAWDR